MRKVLLIDDSPTQLQVREAVLREAGFLVLTASTAEEALRLLSNPGLLASLGVVITDHVMPEVSGDTFVRELRRVCAQVSVIVITGMAEAEEEYAGLNVTFLHKPCPPEELIRQVHAGLNTRM